MGGSQDSKFLLLPQYQVEKLEVGERSEESDRNYYKTREAVSQGKIIMAKYVHLGLSAG